MTSDPLPAECAEVQRRLADSESGHELLDHLTSCQACSAFAAALVELEARLARLPQPEPPAGAVDRAITRFRAELAAHGSPGTAPAAPVPPAPPLTPAAPPLASSSSPSPSAGTAPPSRRPPARPSRAAHARRRRWRPRVSLVAGVAAAVVALAVALVLVLGPSTPPAYAAILHEAAVHTGAEKSARFDLSGTIGLSLRGQKTTTDITGTGATQFPDRGELTEVASIFGRSLRQDIVSVGNKAWIRVNGGQYTLVPVPPDHTSPIDQALANPAQALQDLTRVGSGYRSLGTTSVSGTRVRQIRLTIPGTSFHAFGNLPEEVSHWTVVVDVSQANLVLRRFTVTGDGTLNLLGIKVPFTYSLRLTLHDFGARVSIVPPGSHSTSPSAATSPASAPSPGASRSAGRTASSPAPGSTPTPSASARASPSPTPTPTLSSSCPPPAADIAASPQFNCTAPASVASRSAS